MIEIVEKLNDSIVRIRVTGGLVFRKFEGSAKFLIPGGRDENEYEIWRNLIYIFLALNPGESFAFVWDGEEIVRLIKKRNGYTRNTERG